MVVYYNKKDLVSFGNYLLSPHRRALFASHPDLGEKNLEERLSQVNHSDIENWKYTLDQLKHTKHED
jgi:hypothetical protein